MSRYYDKDKLKQELQIEQIYDLLEAWGGEPEYTDNGLIAQTICHNEPGEGSRKLYYYTNTQLFHCFTGCIDPTFDIFELCIKVMHNQKKMQWEMYDAMDYIASYFGINGIELPDEEDNLSDWMIFKQHKFATYQPMVSIQLPEYDSQILECFLYPRIAHWEQEGILPQVSRRNLIGYYPGKEQITIPHYDINNRLIGIRGRTLAQDEAERFGKYRPLKLNGQLYNHPLSMNLYNLNNSKDNIRRGHSVIVFESEKACLQFQSKYGSDNDISVAVCGSSLSAYQVHLLRSIGTTEIILALDRQFQEVGDVEFQRLKAKLIHLYKKYGNVIKITAIFDKHKLSPYKASPIDGSKELFEQLLRERIVPK